MTLSAIAAADGTVHLDTVRESLNNSTFGNPKVDTPTKTIGKDGKARPTKYATRVQKPQSDYVFIRLTGSTHGNHSQDQPVTLG